MIDHHRHHFLETHIQANLNRHENHREADANDGGNQSQSVLKQVAKRKSGSKRHVVTD